MMTRAQVALFAVIVLASWGCEQSPLPPGGATDASRRPDLTFPSWDNDAAVDGPVDFGPGPDLARPPIGKLTFAMTMQATVSSPTAIAVADFNADSFPDVAVTGMGPGLVSIHLYKPGNKPGFGNSIQSSIGGTEPAGIAIADFNGDQKPDIAVVDIAAPTYWVLLGKGGGQFTVLMNSTSFTPTAVAAGDIDRNGFMDLILAGSKGGAGSVHVLGGDGGGKFAEKATYPVGVKPFALALGDLNGDGKSDLVLTDPTTAKVYSLLGSGGFSFAPAQGQAAVRDVVGIALGLFDHDALLDAMVALASNQSAAFMKGGGDGSLLLKSSYAVGQNPIALVEADFDKDGNADVATADSTSGSVTVLRGYGDGTFHIAEKWGTGITPIALATADFNLDGLPDIVVANLDSGTLTLLINTSK